MREIISRKPPSISGTMAVSGGLVDIRIISDVFMGAYVITIELKGE